MENLRRGRSALFIHGERKLGHSQGFNACRFRTRYVITWAVDQLHHHFIYIDFAKQTPTSYPDLKLRPTNLTCKPVLMTTVARMESKPSNNEHDPNMQGERVSCLSGTAAVDSHPRGKSDHDIKQTAKGRQFDSLVQELR